MTFWGKSTIEFDLIDAKTHTPIDTITIKAERPLIIENCPVGSLRNSLNILSCPFYKIRF